MNQIVEGIQSLPAYQRLVSQIEKKETPDSLGLNRAARLPILTALHQTLQRPLLLLTQKTDRALTLADELALWAPEALRYYFPENQIPRPL
jgi:hypothetical protein